MGMVIVSLVPITWSNMTRYDDQIRKLNPWWRGADAVARDAHLRQRAEAGFLWTPPALEAIPLDPGSTHTLRGPLRRTRDSRDGHGPSRLPERTR
jgi:hypothetical protein